MTLISKWEKQAGGLWAGGLCLGRSDCLHPREKCWLIFFPGGQVAAPGSPGPHVLHQTAWMVDSIANHSLLK